MIFLTKFRDQKYVKGYGFVYFTRNKGKLIGKKMSKKFNSLSSLISSVPIEHRDLIYVLMDLHLLIF